MIYWYLIYGYTVYYKNHGMLEYIIMEKFWSIISLDIYIYYHYIVSMLDIFDIFWQSPTWKNRFGKVHPFLTKRWKQSLTQMRPEIQAAFLLNLVWAWTIAVTSVSLREIQTKLHKTAPALHLKPTVYIQDTAGSLWFADPLNISTWNPNSSWVTKKITTEFNDKTLVSTIFWSEHPTVAGKHGKHPQSSP